MLLKRPTVSPIRNTYIFRTLPLTVKPLQPPQPVSGNRYLVSGISGASLHRLTEHTVAVSRRLFLNLSKGGKHIQEREFPCH